ncbi:MAG: DEAD/DEAH box helicase [Clostridia bacterium]|nr:DEAD/DEAH box helicase [Clostridia bacterium]
MSIFERYAPQVQNFIYRNGWESLRAIQVAAGEALFLTDSNVLLSASTASGKTEAAFFPIITDLIEDPPASVGALYIGPLKALINDQFSRLTELCEETCVPVWHWHGDVGASHKSKLLKNPSGILQITPESLEALLLRKHSYIPKLFCDLRYIVIDEIHALMRADRGGQTMCLIQRLSRLAGVDPRRIGLSATIGDPEGAVAFLSRGSKRSTLAPKIDAAGTKWRLSVEHFYVSGPQASEDLPEAAVSDTAAICEDATDEAPRGADPGIGYIYEHTRGKKCLVFVNSREECEAVTSTLRSYCDAALERDRFMIHHGNLSASYRESAEDAMKDDDTRLTTVTTATLELGIDIGRLERAFQIDAPYTVSSFLQRLGRTGRRGAPPEMWFVIREDEPPMRTMTPSAIPWKLIQAAALIQLYIEERWVEPPRLGKLPFSLLYHQTMSTLASSGELSPSELASRILPLGPFENITQDDFKALLRHLIETDHIQKTEEGTLIVGLAGERVVNSFKFYAVFKEDEEFTVKCDSEEIGTVVMPPPAGEKLALAGRVWTVEEIDRKRKVVFVSPVKGKVPAYFGECPGDINTKVLERMRRVLEEDTVYPYFMKNAVCRLAKARDVARRATVTSENIIFLGGDMWCLFPWLGTYAFLALERFLKIKCAARLGLKGVESFRPFFIQFRMKASKEEFFSILAEEASIPFDPLDLVYEKEVPLFEKYDEFVPDELIRRGFACGVLDVEEMKKRVLGMK